MKFSICIPNYNYAHYIDRTIRSVLDQPYWDFEILVSDNLSTDESVAVVEGFGDGRIQTRVNRCNVGFAGNLDRAARMATGERMIMLSSDDLFRPESLMTYRAVLDALGDAAAGAVLCSTVDVIDPADAITGSHPADTSLWKKTDLDPTLEAVAGGPVYRVSSQEMLRRCLGTMKNPFNFLATCYPRELYEQVEGYGGNRLLNPDMWFHWKLLGVAETVIWIDRPLFAYRWHPTNQTALQAATGALKYMVDQYVNTLEADGELLTQLGLKRDVLERAFVEFAVARHGLATLARGERAKARRILNFGRAVYPQHMRHNKKARALAVLLKMGPVGERIASTMYERYRSSADYHRGPKKAQEVEQA